MAPDLGAVPGVQEAAHRGQAGWAIDLPRWAQLRAGVDAVCPAQHSCVGNCFHVLCLKGRLLLSRAGKEEANLQSLSNVALIRVVHLDGA